MNSVFSINVDLSDVIANTDVITKEIFPKLHKSVGAVAQTAQAKWVEAVAKTPGIWQGERDRYIQSIQWRYDGDFAAVVWSDYDVAEQIESGRPQRDLKRMLDTSPKVRRTEDGRRFMIIPMRHNTPGSNAHARAMPQSVFAIASQMAKSTVTGSGQRAAGEVTRISPRAGMTPSPNQTPYLSATNTKSEFMVTRHHYQWGDRLTRGQLKQAGMSATDAKRYAGMVRMETSSGAAKSSAYMTFRVMMEGSTGWVIPAQPGKWIAKGVAEQIQPVAHQIFQQAVKYDIKMR